MFGWRKASESSRGSYREPAPRKGRFSSATRGNGAKDWKRRSEGVSVRASAKQSRNKRIAPEKTPAPSKFATLCDWGRVRLWVVGVFFLLLWCGLWGRAYHLQINMGPEYSARAKRQHTAKEVIRGARGNILDRNGNIMARSVECDTIWVNPSQVQDKKDAAARLAKALRLPFKKVQAALEEKKGFVYLSRKVDYRTSEAVKALGIPGVYMDSEYERIYPYKHLAGQLLGFVDIDDTGIEGLEKSLEKHLAGRQVTRVVERDAAGRRLMPLGAGSIGDLRGNDLRLTIDTQVQFFTEEALAEHVEKYGARWGGCIVVDVPTGDILAWAQYPFFDPNKVGGTAQADRRNRLATDMLEQGSTIKTFLIAAALEEKVVEPATEINCENGKWKFRRVTLHDTHSYGKLNVEKILHVSSNIGAAKIGLMLGANKYHEYLRRLGFGGATGLPLASEARGILRNPRRWADIDLATASFGQSFSATMAQMAQAYLCLAGEGEKKPLRLVRDASAHERTAFAAGTAASGRGLVSPAHASSPAQNMPPAHEGGDGDAFSGHDRIFSPGTLHTVRSMLRQVVQQDGGTGKQARISGIEVGGKTGTAQKADASGRYGRGRVGSFVGMLPIDKPRFLICVLLDEPTKVQYGGVIAAPVFRHVALNTMAYHGLLPDADVLLARDEEEKKRAEAPGKKPAPVAANKKGTGKGAAAAKGEEAPPPAQGCEEILTEPQITDPSLVPSVVGLGLRTAVEVFAGRGIVPVIKGKGGFVVRQNPEPGARLPESGQECVLWLEEGA